MGGLPLNLFLSYSECPPMPPISHGWFRSPESQSSSEDEADELPAFLEVDTEKLKQFCGRAGPHSTLPIPPGLDFFFKKIQGGILRENNVVFRNFAKYFSMVFKDFHQIFLTFNNFLNFLYASPEKISRNFSQ
jgi:hypothetical protein